ncbi:hypothetical protein M9Y10_009622 [Tritrichomonas musculus]|uniref:Leucine Rich Repeat family protein n=1 Tax=Tritrichomonas musculus TaxID=1915356 RepID=A0ABR2IQD1_9EUKA
MTQKNETDTTANTDQVSFLEELYVARCKDTLEQPSREEFLRFNSRLKSRSSGPICSLRNQHLGVSAANTLSKFLRNRTELVKLDLYCNLIRDHGLQVVSHLLHLNPSIRIFNIGCNDLTDKAAPYLAEIIGYGNVESLQVGMIEKSLHPNKLTAVTLDAVAEALVKSNTLKSLGINGSAFSHKSIPNVPSAEVSLIKMLSKCDSLQMLRMSNCEITSPMMLQVIENGLCYNCTLLRLDISNNNLNTAVGVRLAQYLLEKTKALDISPDEENPDQEAETITTDNEPHLFYLDASKNQFTVQVASAFSKTLLVYSNLGYLDLSYNDLGDDGAMQLAQSLRINQTLVELHLSSTKLTSTGGISIAESLKENQTLTTLNLSKNKLGDATAYSIAEMLTVNKTLATLMISSAMLSNDGGIQIAQASPLCPSLTSIDMSDNFFTEDAGSAMEKLFRDNPTILKIDVNGTQINHFSFHALNEICARNAAMLKQKEQKPLRNQLVKSQYSVVELQRKKEILRNLIDEKNDLQNQIDELNQKIMNLKSDEEVNASMLTKQIQEREQQMTNEKVDFEEKMNKLQESLKEFEEKKEEISKTLESQLKSIEETQAKIKEKNEILQKMTEEFEAKKAEKLKEIEMINNAADELLKLSQDPEALAAMEQLPEFIEFEEDKAAEEARRAQAEAEAAAEAANKKKKHKKKGK